MRFGSAIVPGLVLVMFLQFGCAGGVAQSSAATTASAATAAKLVSMSPATVAVGHASFSLTVSGTNFSSQSVIVWNGAAVPTTFVSSEELTAQISATSVAKASGIPVTVKNSQSGESANVLSFTVGAAPEITTTALPAGHAGMSYVAPLSVSGGVAPFHWSVVSNALPAGLALNSQTGTISGTAAEPDDETVSVKVTDAVNSSTQANLPIQILAAGPSSAASASASSSGQFYGSGIGSDGLANTTVGPQGNTVSYRFRAEHSGAVQQAMIYLIPDHSGYAGGNAGTTLITINTDDGTAAHNPGKTVLASYTMSGVLSLPAPARYFYTVKFSAPPTLTAGQIYHMVFKNVDSAPASNFLSVDALYELDVTDPVQDGLSATNAAVLLGNGSGSWAPRPGYTPIYQLQFTNGVTEGIGYIEGWIGAPRLISGTNAVRETFTVSGSDVRVNSLRVRVARELGNDPLVVRLENANGTLIEQGSIPAASVPPSLAIAPAYYWVNLPLSTTYTLVPGNTYHLDLEASSTSVYATFPIRKGAYYGFQPSTFFNDGHAEFEQGGSWYGWTQWGTANRTDGDLQFYFPAVP
jgi:hypothetical protein